MSMAIAHSKLTAPGQISVPTEVRKRLGVGPGSVLESDEKDDQVIVRRAVNSRFAFIPCLRATTAIEAPG